MIPQRPATTCSQEVILPSAHGRGHSLIVARVLILRIGASNVAGYVEARVLVKINPGHYREIETDLDSLAAYGRENVSWGGYHRFVVGAYDLGVDIGLKDGHDCNSLVKTVALIATLHEFRKLCARRPLDKYPHLTICETGMSDMSTFLTIPFPRLYEPNETDLLTPDARLDHVPLLPLLQQTVAGGRAAYFHADSLERAMQRLGFPEPYVATILYLFQNFAECIGDPLFFDEVLELFDIFNALYRAIVTEERCIDHKQEPTAKHKIRRGLSEKAVRDLGDLIEAIDNAISHRVAPRPPHTERRDHSVDLEAGFTDCCVVQMPRSSAVSAYFADTLRSYARMLQSRLSEG